MAEQIIFKRKSGTSATIKINFITDDDYLSPVDSVEQTDTFLIVHECEQSYSKPFHKVKNQTSYFLISTIEFFYITEEQIDY